MAIKKTSENMVDWKYNFWYEEPSSFALHSCTHRIGRGTSTHQQYNNVSVFVVWLLLLLFCQGSFWDVSLAFCLSVLVLFLLNSLNSPLLIQKKKKRRMFNSGKLMSIWMCGSVRTWLMIDRGWERMAGKWEWMVCTTLLQQCISFLDQ